MAGLKAARARGRRGGRKFALTKAQVRLAQAAMAHRDTSVSALVPGARAETLHIVADGGGSNSCTARAWKFNLQTSLIHTCDFVNRGIFDFYGAVRIIDQGT